MVNETHGGEDNVFKRDRYLVLDSRIIESKENMELTVGVAHKDKNNPLFGEDKPWEPRFDNPYCSVIYDEEEKIYKCWCSIFTKSDYEALNPEKRAWEEWHEGDLVTKTVSDSKIVWKENFGFKNLKNKEIKVKFTLREAKIFSFSFLYE
jgi:hypothetical protein